jgi:hypothetical protein
VVGGKVQPVVLACGGFMDMMEATGTQNHLRKRVRRIRRTAQY